MSKIWSCITTTVIIILATLAVMLVGVRIIGLQVFSVLSGSMEPTYPTGALIYVKEMDSNKLKEGQAITYLIDENTVVTHRITEVIKDENDSETVRYRTKGDANKVDDGTLVHYKNVIGVPVFSIPYMGYVATFVEKPVGKYILATLSMVVLLSVISLEILSLKKTRREKNTEARRRKLP